MKFVLYRLDYRSRVQRPQVRLQRLLEKIRSELPQLESCKLVPVAVFDPPAEGLLVCLPEADETLMVSLRESFARQRLKVSEHSLDALSGPGRQLLERGSSEELTFAHEAGQDLSLQRLECGKSFCHIGLHEDALGELEEAIRLDPACHEAYHYYAAIQRQLGRPERARRLVERGLRFNRQQSPFHFLLGELSFECKHNEAAVHHLKEAIRLNPSAGMPYARLGDVLQHLGQVEQARLAYEEGLAKEPDLPEAAAGLGAILLERGRINEAAGWLHKALSDNPDLSETRLRLGWCYFHMGLVDRAEVEFLSVANGPDRDYRLPARFSLGRLYLHQENFNLAAEILEEVVAMQPDLAEAHNQLAEAQFNRDEFEAALVHWTEAVRLDPARSHEVQPQMILCLVHTEQFREAELRVRRLLKALGPQGGLLELQAAVLIAQGKWKKSWAVLQEAHALDPESSAVAFQMGWTAENLGRSEEAHSQYSRAIRLDPEFSEAYAGLGWIYYEREQYAVALVLFEKALELDPKNAELIDAVGWVQLVMGDPLPALAYFERAVALESDCPFYRSHLAAALLHADRYEEAERHLERALAEESDSMVESFCHYLMGLIHQSRGETEQASLEFARSTKDQELPHEFLVVTPGGRLRQGRKSEVWQTYRKSAREQGDVPLQGKTSRAGGD